MNIVIVGCGKVGSVLAEQLSKEKHEVTVIDSNAFKIERMQEKLDIQGVVGNGSSYQVQLSAGLKRADLLIAVTSKDEINLLSCLIARKGGHCHTIARVRDYNYYSEIDIIKDELGLSMFANPEREAAHEIARLIQVPSALELDVFARGRVNMVGIKVNDGSVLDGMRLLDVRTKINPNVLVCIINRNGETIIPKGQDFIRKGDSVSFIVPISEMTSFFQRIGVVSRPIKNVMIAGGGTVAYYLATMLALAKINVKIIESDKKRCEELAEKLDEAKIIYGDATNQDLLHEEEIDKTDAFVSLTNMDEENIMLSLYANEVSEAKLITKINKITFDNVIKKLSIGSVISPKNIIAERIIRYVRTIQNSRGSNIETLYRISEKAEAIEFKVKETQKDIIGIPIMELKIKEGILICAINRKGKIITPGGKDTIQAGDNVIVVTNCTGLEDVGQIIEKA